MNALAADNHDMAKYGIIYIIQNELHPSNIYKVGYTTKSIGERLDELNRETSNPGRFAVCGYFPVSDVAAAERLCHQELEHLRVAKRKEFFHGPISRLLTEVEKVCALFHPMRFISEKHMDGEEDFVGSQMREVTTCNECRGNGKVRSQQGFVTIEKACSNCDGRGIVRA